MQKALSEMNLQLHHVVADITGTTGLRIIRAILAGERDPAVLALLRDTRCHASVEIITQALTGHYRAEHLFALEQALALYRRLSARIGKIKAITATARKIAVLFHNALRHGMDYIDPGASSYETRYRARVIENLHRSAKAFGFVLHPAAPQAVS